MILVIASLILFGIATTSIVLWTVKKPTAIKIVVSVLFVLTFIGAIGWALKEFSN